MVCLQYVVYVVLTVDGITDQLTCDKNCLFSSRRKIDVKLAEGKNTKLF